MALLQISEPGQAAAPHQRKLAAGIDLGTTNSLVATVRSGKAETLPDVDGNHLLPSIVRYREGDLPQVGLVAKQSSIEDPRNTIVSVKRYLGEVLQIFASSVAGRNTILWTVKHLCHGYEH